MKRRLEVVKIGNKIRSLREGKGYAQETFAREIEIGRAFYGRIERGEVAPGSLILIKISKALNVEVGDLFPLLAELKEMDKDK